MWKFDILELILFFFLGLVVLFEVDIVRDDVIVVINIVFMIMLISIELIVSSFLGIEIG